MKNRRGKYSRRPDRKQLPIALVVFLDCLAVGLILVTFAFFHHVLPAMVSEYERLQAMAEVTEAPQTQAPETVADSTVPGDTETEGQPLETEVPTEAPTEPDNRTEWQIKFADKFTDEVVMTENSYSSPEVSITLETVTIDDINGKITYHVADIYVASLENFVTHTADGEMRYFGSQDPMEMDAAANAILSLSGDFLTYQKSGFLMRNGEIYTSTDNLDNICVLYSDGVMEAYEAKTYDIDEIIARGAVQVWSFGPVLLDENGAAKDYYNVSSAVNYTNPRSAIGYYEPGHYVFVLVDGRQEGYSRGMKLPELAQVFADLGCTMAYNLDGGGSAVMIYDHERYSRQSNGGGRELGDILVIRDSYYGAAPEEEAGE